MFEPGPVTKDEIRAVNDWLKKSAGVVDDVPEALLTQITVVVKEGKRRQEQLKSPDAKALSGKLEKELGLIRNALPRAITLTRRLGHSTTTLEEFLAKFKGYAGKAKEAQGLEVQIYSELLIKLMTVIEDVLNRSISFEKKLAVLCDALDMIDPRNEVHDVEAVRKNLTYRRKKFGPLLDKTSLQWEVSRDEAESGRISFKLSSKT
jgi:hypothetical protein